MGSINPGPRLADWEYAQCQQEEHFRQFPALPPSPSIIPSLVRINPGLTRVRF